MKRTRRAIGAIQALAFAAILALALPAIPIRAQETPAPSAEAPAIPDLIPTSAFAAASPFGSARISPDGARLAIPSFKDGQSNVAIFDIAADKFSNQLPIGETMELEWVRWAGNNRLLVSVSGTTVIFGIEVRFTRLFVMDLERNVFAYVGNQQMGILGDDVLHIDPSGNWILLAMQRDVFSEPAVWRLSLDRRDTTSDHIVQKRQQWHLGLVRR
jgi:hypothetical protein